MKLNLKKGDERPIWIQRIAEEESRRQGCFFLGDKYNFGCTDSQVHKEFIWSQSRQGRSTWRELYQFGDCTILKDWAIKNGMYDKFYIDL